MHPHVKKLQNEPSKVIGTWKLVYLFCEHVSGRAQKNNGYLDSQNNRIIATSSVYQLTSPWRKITIINSYKSSQFALSMQRSASNSDLMCILVPSILNCPISFSLSLNAHRFSENSLNRRSFRTSKGDDRNRLQVSSVTRSVLDPYVS